MSNHVGMGGYAGRANFYATQTPAVSKTQDAASPDAPVKQLNSPNKPAVIVSLSPQAQAVLDSNEAQEAGQEPSTETAAQEQAERGAAGVAKLV